MFKLQDFLCGACAQDNQLSLDGRIALALSLKRGYPYVCNQCAQIVRLPPYNVNESGVGVRTDAALITGVEELKTVTDGSEAIKKANRNKDAEQLELF